MRLEHQSPLVETILRQLSTTLVHLVLDEGAIAEDVAIPARVHRCQQPRVLVVGNGLHETITGDKESVELVLVQVPDVD